MAIPVTTRSGKGSPLTQAEMDTNLTELARSATELEEGNIEIATKTETKALTDLLKAVVPGNLGAGIEAYADTLTGSLSSDGYFTLPGGLIIQWRSNESGRSSEGDKTFLFPIPFPTACFTVIPVFRGSSRLSDAWPQLNSFSNSSVSIKWQSPGSTFGGTVNLDFIAIGY